MFKNIQIVGNVGKDPVVRHLPSGGMAGNFSVAVNESWTTKEGAKDSRVTWFNVVAYQTGENGLVTALIQKYLRQGQLVFISGDPNIRRYTAQDGSDRFAFEIKLGPQSTIKMLGGRPNGERAEANGHDSPKSDGEGAAESYEGGARKGGVPADEDIPF